MAEKDDGVRAKVIVVLVAFSVLFGVMLMTLESIKNYLYLAWSPEQPIHVRLPLLFDAEISLLFIWDLAMVVIIVTYIATIGLALHAELKR